MICALIQDNMVVKVITVSSEEEYQEVSRGYSNSVDITNSNPQPIVGWVFTGNDLIPGEGQDATATRKITKLGLRRRLTFTELCGLTGAASTTVQVAALLGNLNVATYVDLNRADTVGGINLLVALGLLTSDRAAIILNAPIQADEQYKGTE